MVGAWEGPSSNERQGKWESLQTKHNTVWCLTLVRWTTSFSGKTFFPLIWYFLFWTSAPLYFNGILTSPYPLLCWLKSSPHTLNYFFNSLRSRVTFYGSLCPPECLRCWLALLDCFCADRGKEWLKKHAQKNDFKSIFIFQPGPKLGLSTTGGKTFSNLLPVADKHQVCGQSSWESDAAAAGLRHRADGWAHSGGASVPASSSRNPACFF